MFAPELGCAENLPDPRSMLHLCCSGRGQPQALLSAAPHCEPCSPAPAKAESGCLSQGQPHSSSSGGGDVNILGLDVFFFLACFSPSQEEINGYLQRVEPPKACVLFLSFMLMNSILGLEGGLHKKEWREGDKETSNSANSVV